MYGLKFLTLSLLGPLAVQAGCFSGGEPWPSRSDAKSKIPDICKQDSGIIDASITKSHCINGLNGNRYNFEIKNAGSASQILSLEDCERGLQRPIDACGNGGDFPLNCFLFK